MAVNTGLLEYITGLVIREIEQMGHTAGISAPKVIPVGISARHVHLQPDHLEALFGKGYKLKKLKDLSQPGQFAAEETVTITGPRGSIAKVRILGPERKQTQVEISASDARTLGVPKVVRNSGDLEGTPGITITGPMGSVDIESGVIVADRHIHMSPQDAEYFGVKNGERVRVRIPGPKGGIMDNVTVRVSDNYRLDRHVDTDEANAFLLKQGDLLELVK